MASAAVPTLTRLFSPRESKLRGTSPENLKTLSRDDLQQELGILASDLRGAISDVQNAVNGMHESISKEITEFGKHRGQNARRTSPAGPSHQARSTTTSLLSMPSSSSTHSLDQMVMSAVSGNHGALLSSRSSINAGNHGEMVSRRSQQYQQAFANNARHSWSAKPPRPVLKTRKKGSSKKSALRLDEKVEERLGLEENAPIRLGSAFRARSDTFSLDLPGGPSLEMDVVTSERDPVPEEMALFGPGVDSVAVSRQSSRALVYEEGTARALSEDQAWSWCSQRRAMAFVDSTLFDASSCIIVVLNSIWLGFEVEYAARQAHTADPHFFEVINDIFCAVFTAELLLRVNAFRWEFVTGGWNLFDSLLVVLQIIEIVSNHIINHSESSFDVTIWKIFRLLRIVRIARIIRIIRFIEELRTIVSSIAGSMKSLMWTLLLLLVMMYAVSVCFTQISLEIGLEAERVEHLSPEARRARQQVLDYYGGLTRTVMNLFAAITGGINWIDMANPLITVVSPFMGVVYCFYIAFCIFALMNVVTGVFVEQAMQTAQHDKDVFLTNNLCSLFPAEGEVNWEAFQSKLHTQEMQEYFAALGILDDEAHGLFQLLDTDRSGTVGRDEFVAGLLRLKGHAKALDLALLIQETCRLNSLHEAQSQFFKDAVESIEKLLLDSYEVLTGNGAFEESPINSPAYGPSGDSERSPRSTAGVRMSEFMLEQSSL